MADQLTLQVDLSPAAKEMLRRLIAEICALRDQLERLNNDDVEKIGREIEGFLERMRLLKDLVK